VYSADQCFAYGFACLSGFVYSRWVVSRDFSAKLRYFADGFACLFDAFC
jgi:hypothetical protein